MKSYILILSLACLALSNNQFNGWPPGSCPGPCVSGTQCINGVCILPTAGTSSATLIPPNPCIGIHCFPIQPQPIIPQPQPQPCIGILCIPIQPQPIQPIQPIIPQPIQPIIPQPQPCIGILCIPIQPQPIQPIQPIIPQPIPLPNPCIGIHCYPIQPIQPIQPIIPQPPNPCIGIHCFPISDPCIICITWPCNGCPHWTPDWKKRQHNPYWPPIIGGKDHHNDRDGRRSKRRGK